MSKYTNVDELKRAIFFNDYSPAVVDDNANSIIFQILQLIDTAPALELEISIKEAQDNENK